MLKNNCTNYYKLHEWLEGWRVGGLDGWREIIHQLEDLYVVSDISNSPSERHAGES